MRAVDKRSEEILKAIITEYISTGEPVGSRTISKRKDIGLSAASIRNIMSDLTDMGFIAQPHVSAGRVPTDRAYRFYVDSLLESKRVPSAQEAGIESGLKTAGLDIRDLLKRSSGVLAEFSKQAGLVIRTPFVDQTFKTIEFMKLAEDRILVILISTTGTVYNKIIFDENNIRQEKLESYSRMLNDILKNLDLQQARSKIEQELATEKAKFDAVLTKTLNLCRSVLSIDSSREIFIEGQANILEEPEFSQVEILRAILNTFEEKSRLLRILDRTLEERGIQILIGSEHGVDEIATCAIIAYPIRADDKVIGSIGVIGPKRMDYEKVVPLVDTTAKILTRLLKKIVENMT